ncbi:hypothetical protein SLA2020_266930 [Shorea laevis]
MSRIRKEIEALVKKLKEKVKDKHRTQGTVTTPTSLTFRNEIKVSFWKRQAEVLGEEDTKDESVCYSNFSVDEGSKIVAEEELDLEEHPNIYYDSNEDGFFYKPTNVLSDVDGPKSDSDTSGTFLSRLFRFIYQISRMKFL